MKVARIPVLACVNTLNPSMPFSLHLSILFRGEGDKTDTVGRTDTAKLLVQVCRVLFGCVPKAPIRKLRSLVIISEKHKFVIDLNTVKGLARGPVSSSFAFKAIVSISAVGW